MVLAKKKQNNPKTFVPLGIHPDHIRGAVLWHLRNERPHHILWQELQLETFRLLHSFHPGWASTRGPARTVQTQDHPHHLPRLPVHQDTDQHHPQRGSRSTVCLLFTGKFHKCSAFSCNHSVTLPDYIHTDRSGNRGHAEKDSGVGICHPPGPCRCQDAADGPSGISRHNCKPGKVLNF